MKTTVSIPDDLFGKAEALARKARKSRSEVYAEALREYVARHDPDSITCALDRVVETLEDEDKLFVSASARRTLEQTDW